MIECSACEGKGYITEVGGGDDEPLEEYTFSCSICNGTGLVEETEAAPPYPDDESDIIED